MKLFEIVASLDVRWTVLYVKPGLGKLLSLQATFSSAIGTWQVCHTLIYVK